MRTVPCSDVLHDVYLSSLVPHAPPLTRAGITGQDIVAESESKVDTLMQLSMGRCHLSLQTPKGCGAVPCADTTGKYQNAEQLAGKRIVTSFPNITRKYFAALDARLGTTTAIRCHNLVVPRTSADMYQGRWKLRVILASPTALSIWWKRGPQWRQQAWPMP